MEIFYIFTHKYTYIYPYVIYNFKDTPLIQVIPQHIMLSNYIASHETIRT